MANLNLAVANVALPSIGKAFDASQTALNMIAVGTRSGLAASVLYLGAVGDRYGRKLLLIVGHRLAIPASLSPVLGHGGGAVSGARSSAASAPAWPTRPRWR